jgi:hypothetical protein
MTLLNVGTGGALSGINSAEDWFVGTVNYLLAQQLNTAKNPTSIKNLERNINSSGAMSGSLVVPVTLSAAANGLFTMNAASYLTGVVWTPPSGGDVVPPNEVIAVIDAARRIKILEMGGTASNPSGANCITELTFSMGTTSAGGSTNGTCTVRWSGFPLDMNVGANGDVCYSGRPYLN